jgi:hypothetical protein
MRRRLGWIFSTALRMIRGWSIGKKKTRSASGTCVLAASFPVEVIVVKTILEWGNSFLIFLRRGIPLRPMRHGPRLAPGRTGFEKIPAVETMPVEISLGRSSGTENRDL